jgi:hypothetical protein
MKTRGTLVSFTRELDINPRVTLKEGRWGGWKFVSYLGTDREQSLCVSSLQKTECDDCVK